MLPGRSFASYLARFRNASLEEIVHRVREALLIKKLKRDVQSGSPIIFFPEINPARLESLKLPDFKIDMQRRLLKSISDGAEFTLYNDQLQIVDFVNKCRGRYFSVIHSPETLDIRNIWEPARLQHITVMLFASLMNESGFDSDALRNNAIKALLKWMDENIFLTGPHYMSVMECGLRIPVFFYSLKILNNLSKEEVDRIISTIYEHAWWISKRLSLYSSLGNHTLCECIGLIFAGALFGDIQDGKEWLRSGIRLLDQEISHQILNDGGPAEQSLSYHLFVLDLYWLALNFLENNGLYDCSSWKQHLIRGEKFLNSFETSSGPVTSFGDSDNGYAVAPSGICPVRGRSESIESCLISHKESGYSIIRLDKDSVLTFDHGPLGMAPLYNHGHADALSVTLSVKGKPILIDPGTYRYNGVPKWRKYFKSTRAHNTVNIDSEDQAVQSTGFIWSNPYTAKLTKSETSDGRIILSAEHDGYMRLISPVMHMRTISVINKSRIVIEDKFSGKGINVFELNFHFHPECELRKCEDCWRIQREDAVIYIKISGDFETLLISGQESPPFGWYSKQYGIKEKNSVLSCRKQGKASEVIFRSVIHLGENCSPESYLEMAH